VSVVGVATEKDGTSESRDPDDLGFLELSSDLVCICRDDRIAVINKAGARILKAAGPADLVGRRFHDFLAADYAEAVDVSLTVLVDESQPFPLKLIALDGTEVGVQVSVFLAGEADPSAVIVFARDVTRQVELSEAIHRSEQRFRSIVNHALDLICVCENERIGFVNRAGLRLLGATRPEEVVGRKVSEFLHADYRDIFSETIGPLLREDSLLPIKMLRLDGRVVDVEVGLTPFDGMIGSQYLLEARDITDHNRHVTALRKMIETLELRVRERTAELTREVAERRKAEEAMRHMASHDVLTGLPNRYLFKDRFAQALARAKRDSGKAALLFVDLDGFKPVNDTHGHDVGDLLLKGVAMRLESSLRATDTVARIGGDEFVVALTDIQTVEDATRIAGNLIDALNVPFDLAGREIRVGASVGVALFPDHGATADDIGRAADAAMYAAKRAGKNGWRLPSFGV
jgi:diguanylate cyclase (GGDEF)-like protein/PAS domain S-box-containing protein